MSERAGGEGIFGEDAVEGAADHRLDADEFIPRIGSGGDALHRGEGRSDGGLVAEEHPVFLGGGVHRGVFHERHCERPAVGTYDVDSLPQKPLILPPDILAVGSIHEDAAARSGSPNLCSERMLVTGSLDVEHFARTLRNTLSGIPYKIHQRRAYGTLSGDIQVQRSARRHLKKLPVDGVQGLPGHRKTDCRVDIGAVRRAGQGLDSSLLEAVFHPCAGGLAVDAAGAHKADKGFPLKGIVGAGHTHPLANLGFRHGGHHRAGVLGLESIEDVDGDAGFHRGLHGGCIEHLGTVGSHIQGGLIGHFGNGAGGRDHFGVGGHYAGHVRPDFQASGLEGRGIKSRAEIRPATPQGCHLSLVFTGNETRCDEDLHLGLQGHSGGYVIVGKSGVILYDEDAGIQPFGAEALAAEFFRDYCSGEEFSEGDHFILGGGGEFAEKGLGFF